MTWNDMAPLPAPRLGLAGNLRFIARTLVFGLATLVLLTLVLLAYLLERVTGGRGVSDRIVRSWGRLGRIMCGLRLRVQGQEMAHGGALVSNHISWSDIFVLHNAAHIHFVAKSEVRSWPGIGFLAAVTGTLFIERRRAEAKAQQQQLKERLQKGDRLCFFPEGTSTDGRRVLDFKSALFSAFHTPELLPHMWVQPVSIAYIPAPGFDDVFYGWWGDMDFASHMRTLFGLSRGGQVVVTFHPPVRASDFPDRKDLARHCTLVVRQGVLDALAQGGRPAAPVAVG